MDFFGKTKAIRLKSHLNKYLSASDDEQSVKQRRNGASLKARWEIEPIQGKNHQIRLRSCYEKYLSAAEDHFILGMVGRKVLQTNLQGGFCSQWEPVKEGEEGQKEDSVMKMRLRTIGGRFLRANGATPPWRNSVTHNAPKRGMTHDWDVWEVEPLDFDDDQLSSAMSISSSSSFSSISEDFDHGLPLHSSASPKQDEIFPSGMDLFKNAKSILLKSHCNKYLLAGDDEESVSQERNMSSSRSRWTVEYVDPIFVRLKSCYGKYLTATDHPFLLGATGKKVLQGAPCRLDSSVEWEPLKEGFQLRLKTRYGNFLRANGGIPPWRNSITHDVPHRTATRDWVLWDVEIVDVRGKDSEPVKSLLGSVKAPVSFKSNKLSKVERSDKLGGSPKTDPGREIRYSIEGSTNEECIFNFKGNGVGELKERLQVETGLKDIVVCSCNPLNGNLCPLRLALPPNNATMHLVVVHK